MNEKTQITICIGEFTLIRRSDGSFWLCRDGGEVMETTERKVAKMLEEFFEREM